MSKELLFCRVCNDLFTPPDDWGTDKAKEEFQQRFEGEDITKATLVCQDCYDEIMAANNPFKAD